MVYECTFLHVFYSQVDFLGDIFLEVIMKRSTGPGSIIFLKDKEIGYRFRRIRLPQSMIAHDFPLFIGGQRSMAIIWLDKCSWCFGPDLSANAV